MARGVHRFHLGAEPFPEGRELRQRLRLSRRPGHDRRQDMPGPLEQRREAGIGAGLLGARNRVSGDHVDAAIGGRRQRARRFAFHGADIGQDGAGLHRRHRPGRDIAQRANRHAQDHAIGLRHGGFQRRSDLAEADLGRTGAHIRIGVVKDDLAGRAIFPRRPGDRGADQARPDDGDTREDRISHGRHSPEGLGAAAWWANAPGASRGAGV